MPKQKAKSKIKWKTKSAKPKSKVKRRASKTMQSFDIKGKWTLKDYVKWSREMKQFEQDYLWKS